VVLGRNTARTTTVSGYRHHPLSLLLISLSNGLYQPLLINGYTRQLVVRQASELYEVFLQVDGESYMVQVGLLLTRVDVVRPVLPKGIELPRVVEYIVIPLLKVQKLLQHGAEQTRR
jgi:hypothetical protein